MADIYLNTNIVSNETFDLYGNFLRDYNPIFPYKSDFRLHWQLYTNTPGANSDGIDMSSWTKANFSGCGAMVTCDNDFVHRITGSLAVEIISGTTINSVSVNIGSNQNIIPSSGFVTLFNLNGGTKDFAYESVTFSGETGVFTIGEWDADGNYSTGATAKVSQEPYFQSYYNASLSDPEHGLFVFDCKVYSRKLAIQGDAASGRWIEVQGIELLPFQIIDNVYTEMPSYLCDTAKISVNMGESGNNPEITDPIQNMIAAFVTNMISSGMEVQGSEDGENWSDYEDITDFQALRWYRFRINGSGSAWSQAIPLIASFDDCPDDGNLYVRQHGQWIALTGSIGVTITGTSSGTWYLDGENAAHASGETVIVDAGTHVITFGSVSGMVTPASQTVNVTGGGSVSVTAAYTAQAEMYYGYVNDGTTYAVSQLTASMLELNTVTGANPGPLTASINAPAGAVLFALVPADSGLTVVKDDGVGGQAEFNLNNGTTGTGANGTAITLDGIAYLAYGEFNLVDAETIIYIGEA